MTYNVFGRILNLTQPKLIKIEEDTESVWKTWGIFPNINTSLVSL